MQNILGIRVGVFLETTSAASDSINPWYCRDLSQHSGRTANCQLDKTKSLNEYKVVSRASVFPRFRSVYCHVCLKLVLCTVSVENVLQQYWLRGVGGELAHCLFAKHWNGMLEWRGLNLPSKGPFPCHQIFIRLRALSLPLWILANPICGEKSIFGIFYLAVMLTARADDL